MQRPSESRRSEIIEAGARLFAARRFHEVRLDDVATEARVGKGTLYTYFASKEALFGTVVEEAFLRAVAEIRGRLDRPSGTAWERLGIVVNELVCFGTAFPDKFRLMRSGIDVRGPCTVEARRQLIALVADMLRDGIERAELIDLDPEISAACVLSCVRGALLYGPDGGDERAVVSHILRLLGHGMLPHASARNQHGR